MTIYKIPVTIEGAGLPSPAMNIFHVSADGTLNLQEAVDALETFYTAIKSLYSSAHTISAGTGIIADPYGDPTYSDATPWSMTGPGSGNRQPVLLSVVVGWRTGVATRSGRGRTFLGPFTAGSDSDGTPSAEMIGQIRDAADDLVADSQSLNGWELGVFSVKQSTFRPVTAAIVKDRYAYLSSRRD